MMRDKPGTHGERGQGLVLAVLGLAVLMGFVALAVDVGLFLHERRQLQNTADAMALAGAIELPDDPAAALARAREWAANNGVDASDITTVEVRNGDVPNDTVYVRLDTGFGWVFGRALGLDVTTVGADAAAQFGSITGVTGLVPFGVLESAVPSPPLCTYEELIQAGGPPAQCISILKYDVQDVGANIGDLDFDGKGGGANEVNEKIKGGNDDPLCSVNEPPVAGCETAEPSKTGNSTGQIREAMNWRLDNTTSQCDSIAEVVGPDEDGDGRAEVRDECNPWGGAVGADSDGDAGTCDEIMWQGVRQGSCRLIAIPVIQCYDPGDGSCILPPPDQDMVNVKFALFWLLPLRNNQCSGNSCIIEGYFIDAEVSAMGLVGALDPENTPFTVLALVE